jgi:hypothetical protein
MVLWQPQDLSTYRLPMRERSTVKCMRPGAPLRLSLQDWLEGAVPAR